MAKITATVRDGFAALLGLTTKSGATAREFQAALVEAHAAIDQAEAEVVAADAEYRAGLLRLDEAALKKLIDAKTGAGVRRDRAAALVEALEARLTDVRAIEAEDTRKAAYDAAQAQVKDAVSALQGYPALAEKIVTLLRIVNAAEVAVETVNRALPAGAAPLDGPEFLMRGRPARPRKILAEETVSLWCRGDEGWPVPPEYQSYIHADARGFGYMSNPNINSAGAGDRYARRNFIKRMFLPEQPARSPLPLAAGMRLPTFADGDVFAFDGENVIFTDDIANALAVALPVLGDDPRKDLRQPVTEFELIPAARIADAA